MKFITVGFVFVYLLLPTKTPQSRRFELLMLVFCCVKLLLYVDLLIVHP